MYIRKIILFAIFILNFFTIYSQAGKGIYRFLDLPISSHSAAIGGCNISLRDNDINFALMNPALLTSETHGVVSFNIANYLSDIKFGSAMYGYNFDEDNYFSFGIQYVDYGIFEGYDELGQYIEDLTAKDMALYISYARPLNDYLTLGATLKPIASVYEKYTSFGIAMDLGVNYNSDLMSLGLVIRNAGIQLKGYYDDIEGQHRETLPFDIQLGLTKKFEHAPLRFSITAINLNQWNVASYQSTISGKTNLDGSINDSSISFLDMAFRHLAFGAEFIPTKNFYVAAGYNHKRSRELSIDGFKSLAGFSFGAGIKLYKFQVGFAMTQFQAGINAYQFSISTNLNEFISF